jgi:excisionase family DNA binding protein
MLGSLTRELIKQGKYPWCLEEAYCKTEYVYEGPYAQFKGLERRRLLTAWCLAVSLLFTLFYALFPSANVTAFGAALFLFYPVKSFIWLWVASMGSPLKAFEAKLKRTIEILEHRAFSPPRPLHLMTLAEVQAHAYNIISHHYAQYILWAEKEFGKGDEEATKAHATMTEFFDLFKERGLVATKADYKPHFVEAKARFEADPAKPSIIGRPGGEYYSFEEAARALKISSQRLDQLISEDALLAYRDGEQTLLRKLDVDAFHVPPENAENRYTASN